VPLEVKADSKNYLLGRYCLRALPVPEGRALRFSDSGCGTTTSKMESWIGSRESDLVSKWRAPI